MLIAGRSCNSASENLKKVGQTVQLADDEAHEKD